MADDFDDEDVDEKEPVRRSSDRDAGTSDSETSPFVLASQPPPPTASPPPPATTVVTPIANRRPSDDPKRPVLFPPPSKSSSMPSWMNKGAGAAAAAPPNGRVFRELITCRLCSTHDAAAVWVAPCACVEPVHEQCLAQLRSGSFQEFVECRRCRLFYTLRLDEGVRDSLRVGGERTSLRAGWWHTCRNAVTDVHDVSWLHCLAVHLVYVVIALALHWSVPSEPLADGVALAGSAVVLTAGELFYLAAISLVAVVWIQRHTCRCCRGDVRWSFRPTRSVRRLALAIVPTLTLLFALALVLSAALAVGILGLLLALAIDRDRVARHLASIDVSLWRADSIRPVD